MATLRSLPVVVEEWGWDEAIVGATTDDPEALAREVQARVHAVTGLSCAVGIGETRLQAKTATGFAKPGGIARLTRGTWLPRWATSRSPRIWGIGDAHRGAARRRGHPHRRRARPRRPPRARRRRFGPTIGPYLRLLGLGGHDAPWSTAAAPAAARSREVTFERDLTDRSEIEDQLAGSRER